MCRLSASPSKADRRQTDRQTDRDRQTDTRTDSRGRAAPWRAAVAPPTGPDADATLIAIRAALTDDLNAPAALAAVDRWAEQQRLRAGDDSSAPGLISRAVDALLGVAL